MANKNSKSKKSGATKPVKPVKSAPKPEWPYGKKNYVIFAIALFVIILGFIFLGQGSITLAPFLLVVGYCVILPIALVVKGKPERTEATQAGPSE